MTQGIGPRGGLGHLMASGGRAAKALGHGAAWWLEAVEDVKWQGSGGIRLGVVEGIGLGGGGAADGVGRQGGWWQPKAIFLCENHFPRESENLRTLEAHF